MSAQDNGGPAFPRHPGYNEGMTLRDYFAAAALQGLLSGQYDTSSQFNLSDVPQEAYKIADAMLAARKEGAK